MNKGHDDDRWLRGTLRRPAPAAADGCLDAETLAAWADRGLDAAAAAAVELHLSNCPRCLAVAAAVERTAPPHQVADGVSWARLFRWLVPLTAAATAVAIWIAVPDRPITSVSPLPAGESQMKSAQRDAEPLTAAPETSAPELAAPESAAPRTAEPAAPAPRPAESALGELSSNDSAARNQQAASGDRSAPPQEFAGRRERDSVEQAPSAAPVAPAAPTAARRDAAADSLAGAASAASMERSSAGKALSTESSAPSNPLVRWRVVGSRSVERSLDGGRTWAATPAAPELPAGAQAILGIRAVDAERAVARTSDGADVYTTDAGRVWTRVQENSAAPF